MDQRDIFVVEHQVFEGGIEVVGLSESVTRGRLVDHTMFGVTVHTEKKKDVIKIIVNLF